MSMIAVRLCVYVDLGLDIAGEGCDHTMVECDQIIVYCLLYHNCGNSFVDLTRTYWW